MKGSSYRPFFEILQHVNQGTGKTNKNFSQDSLIPGQDPNLECSEYELILLICSLFKTTSVIYWSEFLATDPEVPGSIPGPTTFSEK
jgi:hypothetical protein